MSTEEEVTAYQTLQQVSRGVADIQKQLADETRRHQFERVIIFIDRTNLDHSFRQNNVGPHRIDYPATMNYLRNGRHLQQVRVYYSDYDSLEDIPTPEERSEWERRQEFFHFLRCQGYLLKSVPRRNFDGQRIEKGLDAAVVMDLERLCRESRCDTIILVSGDADYAGTIHQVQDLYGVRVEVAFFPEQTARELRKKATRFINLLEVKDQIVRNPMPHFTR